MHTEIPDAPLGDPGEPSEFTMFWQAYPVKMNRSGALREWWKIRPDLRLVSEIMRAIRILKSADPWKNGYAPSPVNFLKDRRWRDAEGIPDPARKTPVQIRMETNSVNGISELAPQGTPSTPESAKRALREGFLDAWRRDHPGEEPPQAMIEDPIAYCKKRIGSLR